MRAGSALNGTISQYTPLSRTRRAISWVNWLPKSRISTRSEGVSLGGSLMQEACSTARSGDQEHHAHPASVTLASIRSLLHAPRMSAEQKEKPPSPPLRGAAPVNDGEFEVGYDAAFEKRFTRVALVCRLIMVAFVAAALGGFLGHGPFSHATTRAGGGEPSVDYEPVARYGTPTTVTFHVANPSPEPQKLTISMDFKVVQPLGLERENPRPVSYRRQARRPVHDIRHPGQADGRLDPARGAAFGHRLDPALGTRRRHRPALGTIHRPLRRMSGAEA